jgi:hypothetical protein
VRGVDAEYRAYTIEQGSKRVHEVEEALITPAILGIEAGDPARRLVGLDYRLKGRDRLAEKVLHHLRANPDISCEEAFRKVKDAIRYTFQYPENRYADGVHADCRRLMGAGFEAVDLRNSWSDGESKGINSRWRVAGNGQLFEVQFHTRASFEARRLTHDAYERLRDPVTPKAERDALARYQREVSTRITTPPGAPDIPSYR